MERKGITKNLILSAVFAFMVSFAFVGGRQLDELDTLKINQSGFLLKMVLSWLAIGIGSYAFLSGRLLRTRKKESLPGERNLPKFAFLIPLPFWLASLLASFPGVFSYDSYEEWRQISVWELTSHHPVIHELILGGLVDAFSKQGKANIGILIYVIFQIAFILFVFRRLLLFLSKRSGITLQWITVAFFSLSPVLQLFSISTSKDSVFAAFELWFIVEILAVVEQEEFVKKDFISFVIAAFGTMVFRKNGVYIVAFAMILLTVINKDIRKKMLSGTIILAVLYALYVGPIYGVLGVTKGSGAEMLSVPIQQVGRVYHYNKDDINEQDLELMYEVIPEEYWRLYIPSVSDPIKNGFNEESFLNRKKEAFKLWIKLGIEHPGAYINSILANTVDFWNPCAVIDGYRGLYGTDDSTSDYFDYRVSEPGKQIILLKDLNEYYTYISSDLRIGKNVIASVFINPGWYILLWLAALVTDLSKGNKKNIPLHIILFISLLTVFAGPMAIVRYVLIFFIVWPLYFRKDVLTER